jgi:hypothetical protein
MCGSVAHRSVRCSHRAANAHPARHALALAATPGMPVIVRGARLSGIAAISPRVYG